MKGVDVYDNMNTGKNDKRNKKQKPTSICYINIILIINKFLELFLFSFNKHG